MSIPKATERPLVGQRLAEERTRLGLTQAGLAARYGATAAAQSHYECGRNDPSIECLYALLLAGGDPLYVLFGVRANEVASEVAPGATINWAAIEQVVRWAIDAALRGADPQLLSDRATLKELYGVLQAAPPARRSRTAANRKRA